MSKKDDYNYSEPCGCKMVIFAKADYSSSQMTACEDHNKKEQTQIRREFYKRARKSLEKWRKEQETFSGSATVTGDSSSRTGGVDQLRDDNGSASMGGTDEQDDARGDAESAATDDGAGSLAQGEAQQADQ